jgi:glycine oxidase
MNTVANWPRTTDVAIAGGGIIGLSLGLELRRRGLSVAVLDRQHAMSSASAAAGGMLAVHDPQNPPALMPLAMRSRELYPEYLAHIEALSGKPVPLRTHHAMQHAVADHAAGRPVTAADLADFAPGLNTAGHIFEWLEEASLDPNDLRAALPAAFVAAGGTLLEETELLQLESLPGGVVLHTSRQPISAAIFVNCRGAWAGSLGGLPAVPVSPVKGQMANLRCAPHRLRCVVRAPGIYLIPRGDGRVTIGATVEHAGFDQHVEAAAVHRLIEIARELLPEAEVPDPPQMWSGLRPGTPDGLPILGPAESPAESPAPQPHCWHATGHYRDGILLAPATARVMTQALLAEPTDIPLEPFSPARF